MDQGTIFKLIDIFFVVPTGRMLNGIEPRNTDQSHFPNIYYSTEIKSKIGRKVRNWFTYLQSSKNIYISRLISVNMLSYGGKSLVYKMTRFVEKYSFFDTAPQKGGQKYA